MLPILVVATRRGYPSSGHFFNLVVKPLLCRVKSQQSERSILLPAYADDVTIFIISIICPIYKAGEIKMAFGRLISEAAEEV